MLTTSIDNDPCKFMLTAGKNNDRYILKVSRHAFDSLVDRSTHERLNYGSRLSATCAPLIGVRTNCMIL